MLFKKIHEDYALRKLTDKRYEAMDGTAEGLERYPCADGRVLFNDYISKTFISSQ